MRLVRFIISLFLGEPPIKDDHCLALSGHPVLASAAIQMLSHTRECASHIKAGACERKHGAKQYEKSKVNKNEMRKERMEKNTPLQAIHLYSLYAISVTVCFL